MKLSLIVCFVALTLGSSALASSSPVADYEVTGVTRDDFKTIHIKGFVTNTGPFPLGWVAIDASGYNSRHDVIDQGIDIPIGSGISLKPGERAFFDVHLSDRDGNEIVQYALKVEVH